MSAADGAAGHRYEIREPEGTLAAVHVRRDLPGGAKYFRWEGPDGQHNLGGRKLATLPLYASEYLSRLPDSTVIVLTEGEKAADAINGLGLDGVLALGTVTGAGSAPEAAVLAHLARFARVVLWPDNDQPGEGHMVRCAEVLREVGATEVHRLLWADAPDHGDAGDFVAQSGDAAGLRELLNVAETWPAAEGAAQQESSRGGPDRASEILELAGSAGVEVFIWEGQPYVSAPVNGHVETYPLGTRSAAARQYLLRLYRKHRGRLPPKDALSGALEAFAADARFGGEFPVALRVGQLDNGDIAIDRGGPDYTAYVVGPKDWTEAPHPVRFRRPRTIRALPSPVRGGSIDELREFLNLRDHADWYLVLAWLVAAVRPVGPYPVLDLYGEAGTAKSTIAVVLRALVDPSVAALRSLPKDPRDLAVAAQANWCLAFNNVSTILVEVSDALCQLSTGGGFATRLLYSDDEEVVLFGQRPVIINSVEQVVVRGDLLDRSLLIGLPVIARYRDEKEFWAAFYEARPRILGALLDLLVGVMRELPGVRLAELPRMADFAQVGVALERTAGWPEGSFLEAYRGSALQAAETALGGSPVVPILVELARGRGEPMTAGELLEELDRRSGRPSEELRRLRGWPRTPRALVGQFARLAPDLRRAHRVVVERLEPRTSRGHLWQITTGTEDLTVTSVTTAISSSNPGEDRLPAGDDGDGPWAGPAPGGRDGVTLPGDGSDGRVTVGDSPTVTTVSPSFDLGDASSSQSSGGSDGQSFSSREKRKEGERPGTVPDQQRRPGLPLPDDGQPCLACGSTTRRVAPTQQGHATFCTTCNPGPGAGKQA